MTLRKTYDALIVLGGADWGNVLDGAPAWNLAGNATLTREPVIRQPFDQASIHAVGYALTIATIWDNATVDNIRDNVDKDGTFAAIIDDESAACIVPVRLPSVDRDFPSVSSGTAALSLPSRGRVSYTTAAGDLTAFHLANAAAEVNLHTPIDKARDSFLIVTEVDGALTSATFKLGGQADYVLAMTTPGIVPITWPAAWPDAIADAKITAVGGGSIRGSVVTADKQARPTG